MAVSHQAKYFAKYRLKAKNAHGIHSPFVFDLYNAVFDNKYPFYAFGTIASLRAQILLSNKSIEVEDFGAGSHKMNGKKRKLSQIVKHSIQPQKYAELLFRLVNYFQPQTIIETGTSIGITTAYLAWPNPRAKVYTIEGCKETFDVAKENFSRLKLHNIETFNDKIETALPEILNRIGKVDFSFVDAHHQYEATIKQFELLLAYRHENTILVFDDIYWSAGMTKAWLEIKAHPAVRLSIDIYKMGIVFFRKSFKNKVHFVLKY